MILFDVLKEKVRIRNLNDFYEDYKKSLPVLWKYFCFVDDNEKNHMQEDVENGEGVFYNVVSKTSFQKQEGHDGPVSLHWLILGNLFKT